MSVLDSSALYMHVGLTNREWINVISLEVTKTVIDEAVRAFIRAHGVKDVLDRCVFWKTPVVLGDGGCCRRFPVCSRPGRSITADDSQCVTKTCVPYGQMAPFELLNCVCIRHNRLFFEVTDKTVASSRGNNVRQDCELENLNFFYKMRRKRTKDVVKDSLRGENKRTKSDSRITQRHEGPVKTLCC